MTALYEHATRLPSGYRIITNGLYFRTQRRGLFGLWWTVKFYQGSYGGGEFYSNHCTYSEAVKHAWEDYDSRDSARARKEAKHSWREVKK
jgi:hypothetical protein